MNLSSAEHKLDSPRSEFRRTVGTLLSTVWKVERACIVMSSSEASLPHRIQVTVLNQNFWIDPAYSVRKGLGQGAYGCVASAVHRASGESIAIKRISNVFTKRILTKRALREIK